MKKIDKDNFGKKIKNEKKKHLGEWKKTKKKR